MSLPIPETSPRFTIVTSTYNVGAEFDKTALSIAGQTWPNVEWIVIDGLSTDDTVARARSFGGLVTKLVSERDTGIYSAWNKALPFITGDWVLFLGAGDVFFSATVLSEVAAKVCSAPDSITTVYGDVLMVEDATQDSGVVRPGTWTGVNGPWVAGHPMLPSHQAVFQRSCVFGNGFRFNPRFKIAGDNEVVLKELVAGNGLALDMLVAKFNTGGISFQPANRLRMIAEVVAVNIKIGIFFRRPFYQIGLLLRNVVSHALLRLRND